MGGLHRPWQSFCQELRSKSSLWRLDGTLVNHHTDGNSLPGWMLKFLVNSGLPQCTSTGAQCSLLHPMQSLAARTAEQQEVLQGLRDWHHSTHVMFTKKAFETQVKNGAHAHINLLAHSPGARRPSPSCLASRHVLISAVMVPNAVTLMVNGSQPRNRLAC